MLCTDVPAWKVEKDWARMGGKDQFLELLLLEEMVPYVEYISFHYYSANLSCNIKKSSDTRELFQRMTDHRLLEPGLDLFPKTFPKYSRSRYFTRNNDIVVI